MAVIGKIREKSTLLLVIVGGALLAFILTDLFSSGSSFFGDDYEYIGSIDGVKIKGIEFENRYATELENYKTREKTREVPEYTQGQLRDQIWNQYLNELVLGRELDELGVKVSPEELGDMTYGDNPHNQVLQAFTNPKTGQFNKNDVISFLKNMDRDETGNTKKQWLDFEKAIKEERRMNKYYTLIQKGLYTTTQEAEEGFKVQNKRSTVSYIVKRYNDIPDSAATVDDSDLKEYYNKNKNLFREETYRKMEYSIFEILPSPADSAYVKEWVDKTYAGFTATDDDSTFVNANSDREFDFKYYSRNDNNPEIDTNLFAIDSAGYTVPPQIVAGSWKMMRISGIKFAPDSVEARHILLSFTKANKEAINLRMDSLKIAIEGGADFKALAEKHSVDPGSQKEGGNLGWFKEGFMIPIINDSSFNAEVNRIMIVESPFGIHLLQVTAKSPVVKKVQVAIVTRSLDASRETVDMQFTAANNFSIKMAESDEMKNLATEFAAKYNSIDVRESDNMIPELESSRGLIRWAYSATVGQVSEAMQYGNAFIVAKLQEIHEKGIAPMETVMDEVKTGAIKDKKAQLATAEMKGFTDLDEAAKALSLSVQQAEGISFDAYSVPGLGREPNLVGRIYTMGEGDLSIPIKGDNGVYIVRIDRIDDVPMAADLRYIRDQIALNRSTRVTYEVFEALKKRVEIVDNRHRVY